MKKYLLSLLLLFVVGGFAMAANAPKKHPVKKHYHHHPHHKKHHPHPHH
ncbi:MAG TPA: hypothetical protein VMI12_03000 [Puia sp.]|nr:hypothetical protein [Puia sp.]